MPITLRRMEVGDRDLFAVWWRDTDLIALTSGSREVITDKEVEKSFSGMLQSRADRHLMIDLEGRAIGHLALIKQGKGWYEMQIIIGEKDYWGKGHGTEAVKQLLDQAREDAMTMIYLEVRPDNMRAIRSYEKCGFARMNIVEHPENSNLPLTLRMEWNGGKS